MTFEEYLLQKRIDSDAFKAAEEDRWTEWKTAFSQLSPASFTAQRLYLINPIRRRFPWKEDPSAPRKEPPASSPPRKPAMPRPKFR